MSSEPAIVVSNLQKSYRLYQRPFDRLREALSFSDRRFHTEFHALKGLDFEIQKGETVGLIGPNGSGKSTLLEILCGTLEPSHGSVKVDGTIGGLLELGAGFNPEFTGRENVYLNAMIFGLARDTIDEKMEAIEAFADIGDFVDQPVKTYSSGMYVRLAFAAMIGVAPDILVIDEALAVGDVRFQRKCYRHFRDLQNKGATILFVTHAVDLIRTHCTRAIQLNEGQIASIGAPKMVVQSYLESMFSVENGVENQIANSGTPDLEKGSIPESSMSKLKRATHNSNEHRWGDGRASIIDYTISSNGSDDLIEVLRGGEVEIKIMVEFYENLDSVIYGCTLRTLDGVTVFGANTRSRHLQIRSRCKGDIAEIIFQFRVNVLPGEYFISLGVAEDSERSDQIAIDRRYDMLHLAVRGGPDDFGMADLEMKIREES